MNPNPVHEVVADRCRVVGLPIGAAGVELVARFLAAANDAARDREADALRGSVQGVAVHGEHNG